METLGNDAVPTLTRLRARISSVDNKLLNCLSTVATSWEMAHNQDEAITPFLRLSSFSLYAAALRETNETTRERYRYTNLVGFVKFQQRREQSGGDFAFNPIPQSIKFRYPPVKQDDYFAAALRANIPDELEEIYGVTFPDREAQVIGRLQHRLDADEPGFITPEFVSGFWKNLFKISRTAQVITIMELQQREQHFEPGNVPA